MCFQKIEEAESQLYDIFTNVDPSLMEAYILYGHCKFLRNKLDDALDAYFTAIRISNLNGTQLKDPLVH
jgi:cytochrome c-type biogenesis protein CcmH/NrfG